MKSTQHTYPAHQRDSLMRAGMYNSVFALGQALGQGLDPHPLRWGGHVPVRRLRGRNQCKPVRITYTNGCVSEHPSITDLSLTLGVTTAALYLAMMRGGWSKGRWAGCRLAYLSQPRPATPNPVADAVTP